MDHKIELKNGRQIGFAEYGDPDGMPILYFHGFPGSRLEASRFHDVAVSNRVVASIINLEEFRLCKPRCMGHA